MPISDSHPRIPPWEQIPPDQLRRRGLPVLGRLFSGRTYRHAVTTAASGRGQGQSREQYAYLEVLSAIEEIDELDAGKLGYPPEQAAIRRHQLATVIAHNLHTFPQLRDDIVVTGYWDPAHPEALAPQKLTLQRERGVDRASTHWANAGARHDIDEGIDLDPQVHELADDLLAAHRAGDLDKAQQIAATLTAKPGTVDRILSGSPAAQAEKRAPGLWEWRDHVNHLGDSGVYADPAAQATRDYMKQARADWVARKLSPADPHHPGHTHYLQREHHYAELAAAQHQRDQARAERFADQITSWAASQQLDLTAEAEPTGAVYIKAGPTVDPDAVMAAMADLRKRWAPDHLAFAAALGDTRFTTPTESTRQKHDRTPNTPTASLEPSTRDADPRTRSEAAVQAIPDTPTAGRMVTGAALEKSGRQHAEGHDKTRVDHQLLAQRDEHAAGSPYPLVNDNPTDDATLIPPCRDRLPEENHRLRLDRDEPTAPRGRAKQPHQIPEPAEPTLRSQSEQHHPDANRSINHSDDAVAVSPDVRRVEAAAEDCLTRRGGSPTADESPPDRELHPAGREI